MFFFRLSLIGVFLALGSSTTASARDLTICYNYSCATQARISIAPAEFDGIASMFQGVSNAEEERSAIAQAIGAFEVIAGQQTPTSVDKGGNYDDDGRNGRMDCIDNSINTTIYLRVLEENGWLRFHAVQERKRRAPWIFDTHWTAVIEELESHERFAVDSWFFDNGYPAVILEMKAWLRGAGP